MQPGDGTEARTRARARVGSLLAQALGLKGRGLQGKLGSQIHSLESSYSWRKQYLDYFRISHLF